MEFIAQDDPSAPMRQCILAESRLIVVSYL